MGEVMFMLVLSGAIEESQGESYYVRGMWFSPNKAKGRMLRLQVYDIRTSACVWLHILSTSLKK